VVEPHRRVERIADGFAALSHGRKLSIGVVGSRERRPSRVSCRQCGDIPEGVIGRPRVGQPVRRVVTVGLRRAAVGCVESVANGDPWGAFWNCGSAVIALLGDFL